MINLCSRMNRIGSQYLVVTILMLGLVGCVSTRPDMGVQPDGSFTLPAYVRNLPKSRTGNMAQYTVFGKQYRVMDTAANFSERGTASWYGKKFHGRKTSSGEIYDMYAMTAAHKHLPLPTYVRVTNLENGKSIVVKVNDRGPFVGDRIIDLSYTAAQALAMAEQGVAQVQVDALSTHHVAQNPPGLAQLGQNPPIDQPVDQSLDNLEGTSLAAAPAVIEPEVASVPLPEHAQPVLDVIVSEVDTENDVADVDSAQWESNTVAAAEIDVEEMASNAFESSETNTNEVVVDGSEDGFVELTEFASGPAIEEPIDLRSYFIQLGAFSHAPNAHSLVEAVAAQIGLPAYVEQDASRSMFRVKMGPFQRGELLQDTLSQLSGVGFDGYALPASRQ